MSAFLDQKSPKQTIVLGSLQSWFWRLFVKIIMADNQQLPVLTVTTTIRWGHCNYPPLVKVMRFVPSEVPKRKKFIVYSLFFIHLIVFINCLLNFIDNCTQGGIRILYSLFFLLFINPFILMVFYKGFTGICKDEGNLKLYIVLQPIAILLEIIISIISVFGFNGFIRAHTLFESGRGLAGVLTVIVSLIFLLLGLFSAFIYFRILREKRELTVDLVG